LFGYGKHFQYCRWRAHASVPLLQG
jgi:hypothetical protein